MKANFGVDVYMKDCDPNADQEAGVLGNGEKHTAVAYFRKLGLICCDKKNAYTTPMNVVCVPGSKFNQIFPYTVSGWETIVVGTTGAHA